MVECLLREGVDLPKYIADALALEKLKARANG